MKTRQLKRNCHADAAASAADPGSSSKDRLKGVMIFVSACTNKGLGSSPLSKQAHKGKGYIHLIRSRRQLAQDVSECEQ